MPPLPPAELVGEVLVHGMLLPLLAAGAVLDLTSRLVKKGAGVGAVLAVVAGFAVGNDKRHAVEYRLDSDRPFAVGAWVSEFGQAVVGVGEVADGSPPHPPARYWLPWAAAIAAVVGLLGRVPRVPVVVGWLLRGAVAVLVALLLVPTPSRAQLPWLWPALAVVVLVEWGLLDAFAEYSAAWSAFGVGLVFVAAGAVLIHAGSARLMDIAVMLAWSWFGVALASWWTGADVRSAVPIAAVALPGLLLDGQQSTYSDIPTAGFALAALAPLALTPLALARALLPATHRRRWAFVGLGLLAATAGAAIVLAARAETLSFD